jgi:hypothetical protein
VTIKEHIVVINVNSNRKSVSHGFLAGIFGTLDRFGVVVDLISTSEVHVSMAIEDGLAKRILDRLVKELRKIGTVSGYTVAFPCVLVLRDVLNRFLYIGIWLYCRSLGGKCVIWSVSQVACSQRWHRAT